MTTITRNLGLAAMAMFAVVCFGVNPGWSGTDRLHESSPYVSSVVEIVTDSQGNTISGHYAKGPCFIGEYYSAPLTGPWGSSYIWKQDPDGNTLWVKQIAAAVIIDDLGTDADGNIYFMAKYLDAIVLEDNEFVPIDWCDYIIAKLNPQGEYQWITNVGYVDYMSDFCVGSDGSCFITGDLDHGFNRIGPFIMNDLSYSDMFLAKLNASGTWQWAQRATGTSIVTGQIISPDNNGACYVLGKALGDLTIGSFYLPELGYSHMNFVAYYSPNGDVAWVKGLDTDSTPMTIVHDGQGNAYILSNFQYPEENPKIHMVNEDTEPTIVFSMPETGSIWGMGLKTDASGNFYLMGTYSLPFSLEGASFDAQHGVFFLKLDGSFNVVWGSCQTNAFSWMAVTDDGLLRGIRINSDVQPIGGFYTFPRLYLSYVAGMDSCGQIAWMRSAMDQRIGSQGVDLCFDPLGNRYVCGVYEGAFLSQETLYLNKGASGNDIFITKTDSFGNRQWLVSAGGSQNDEVKSIVADGNQNTYVTGCFEGNIQFGDIGLESQGAEDIFLAKLDNEGNWLWAFSFGGTGSDKGLDLALDANGDIYMTGYFSDAVSFGSYPLLSSGASDIFVLKLSNNGIIIDAAQGGGSGNDIGTGIGMLPSGQIAICGSFEEDAQFGDTNLSSMGEQDIFSATLDGNLNWLGTVSAGSSNTEELTGMAIDGDGNRYLTGYFYGASNIAATGLQSYGDSDLFIAKLDKEDNWLWAVSGGSAGQDQALSVAVDQSGMSYLTGFSSSAVTMGDIHVDSFYGINILCAGINSNGTWAWVKHSGSHIEHPLFSEGRGSGIALNPDGNCVVTGKFSGVTSFAQRELNANGYYDYFVGTLEYGVDIEDDTIVPAADITLTAYPNPFTSQLNCSLISKTMKPMDVSIYNLKGQRVRHFA
ncbi:MAG: hypothetical protein PHO16_09640, partial [Candidatus Cloacimonetes bacterium]|nr:hypothetical protein [Candidatus Cloacimonadota bacterium]